MTDARTRTVPPTKEATEVPDETRQQIRELSKHYGSRQIASRVGLGRKVVRRVLSELGIKRLPTPPGKLAPFQEEIAKRVRLKLKVPRILREIRQLGYKGGKTILADHVRTLRAQLATDVRTKVKRRFETPPARELQIDWSPFTLIIAGRAVMVHVLGCLMCYSRKLFLRFFRDERQSTLLEGLASAFEYFGGCALDLVLDNMSTAVLGRIGPDRKPIWHPRFLAFCSHYGVHPVACAPRDPNRKGKKEKNFQLVGFDCLLGNEYASWQDLESHATTWLDQIPDVGNLRIHGTTRQRPNDAFLAERDFLIRLPKERFPIYEDAVRVVDQDSTISVRGTRYSVPASLACRTVAVHLFACHFEVFDDQRRLAFSRTYVESADHGKLVIDPTHYASLKRRPRADANGELLDVAFLRRFPTLQALVDGLKRRMKSLAHIHIRALLRLADRYGHEAFLAAAQRAQQFRRHDSLAVRRILERSHPLPDDEPLSPLGGAGPAIIGDVEPPSLDTLGHLDHDPPSPPVGPSGPGRWWAVDVGWGQAHDRPGS
jgi:transposase